MRNAATAKGDAGDRRWSPIAVLKKQAITVAVLAALSALVLLLYSPRLGDSPMYLHHDEVFFGVQAHAVATTWRDTHGRFLPLYFEVFPGYWYQPILVYFTALFFRVLPTSESALRLPSVFVGLFDVLLLYGVAGRLFQRRSLAVLSAVMLALTPAHFMFSRSAVDPLYPVPFLLGWLWCLLVFLERGRPAVLVVGTSLLGLGFYSHIAGQAMMALYLAMTLGMLALARVSWKSYALALAGFMWPLLLLIPFYLAYPQYALDTFARYAPATAGHHLNTFQQLRELLNYTNLTARITLYFNYFNPGYLFLAGAPNTLHSTRTVGIFLMPLAVFLPVGIYQICQHHRTAVNVLMVLGFATAPLAALAVLDGGAINRELELLPFGVLLAVFGVRFLWSAPLVGSIRPLYVPLSALGLVAAVAYGAWALVRTGSPGGSAVPLGAASVILYGVGLASERMRRWHVVTACLLLFGVVEFGSFYADYFSDYRLRSAGRFEGNVRGALEAVIQREDVVHPNDVYLSETFPFMESFWSFYTAKHRRGDLVKAGRPFDPKTINVERIPDGTFLVMVAGVSEDEAIVRRADVMSIARMVEPDGTTSFIVLQKQRSGS